ncbi:MAG: PD-(D/E)XK nuclease family protein [Candidatus Omnitrophota bacterium]
MSKYYTGRKTKYLFDPQSKSPFRLSRSKIELFMNCPRCFYLDRRLGVGQPPGYPFSLNSAVDKLLKKEFDIYREKQIAHPLMEASGIEAVPFKHAKMDTWRDALHGGIEYLHTPTNLLFSGGIDDVWVAPDGQLFIVDYKSTSKEEEVNIDADWQISYKRQMEIYQWLFRRNAFNVSATGYFVYCNGLTDRDEFGAKLDFNIKIIPYIGDDRWIEGVILDIHKCLISDIIPVSNQDCDFCKYTQGRKSVEV